MAYLPDPPHNAQVTKIIFRPPPLKCPIHWDWELRGDQRSPAWGLLLGPGTTLGIKSEHTFGGKKNLGFHAKNHLRRVANSARPLGSRGRHPPPLRSPFFTQKKFLFGKEGQQRHSSATAVAVGDETRAGKRLSGDHRAVSEGVQVHRMGQVGLQGRGGRGRARADREMRNRRPLPRSSPRLLFIRPMSKPRGGGFHSGGG